MSTENVKAFLNKISQLAGGFDITPEIIKETDIFISSLKESKDSSKDKKEKKEKKDPNAPKKPTNAYIIYAKEMRSEIAEDSGVNDAKELIREIARRWNEEKKNDSDVYQEYTQKLIDAKEKYASDMEGYVPDVKEAEKEKKEKKDKKDPNAPKKPTNAYLIYAKEMRAEIAKDSGITIAKDLIREIARRWNEEKKNDSEVYQEYNQKLIVAKEKYASDMEGYVSEEKEVPVSPKKTTKKSVKKVEEEIIESPKVVKKVDEDDIPEPPKVIKKVVKKIEEKIPEPPKKTVEDEDEDIPEPPKKVVKKTDKKVEEKIPEPSKKKVEDEDDIPEPPKKVVKKTDKKGGK